LLIPQPGAGEDPPPRYREFLEELAAVLVAGHPVPPAARRPSAAPVHGLIGGIAALIVAKVKGGEGERLPELLPEVLELVLTPYPWTRGRCPRRPRLALAAISVVAIASSGAAQLP
jgi:hypothetical protein